MTTRWPRLRALVHLHVCHAATALTFLGVAVAPPAAADATAGLRATDAVPILKDLGYPASKAKILSGSAHTAGDSIKATLLQGFADLPDCSYTDFGVATTYNAKKDVVLVTVVLAAP